MNAPTTTVQASGHAEARYKPVVWRADDSAAWKEWDEFVERSPDGTFYHSSDWLLAVARGMGQDIRVHAMLESGVIRAGAVLRRARKYGMTAGRKPWATAYNGVVSTGNEALDAALRKHLLRAYSCVRLVQAPSAPEPRGDAGGYWPLVWHKTLFLNIADIDALWDSFGRHARQRVRKAASMGVTTETSSDYRAFHAMYTATYARQGLPMPLECEQIETTLRLAVMTGRMRCLAARTKEGELAAFLAIGFDAKRAYFALAASHPEHRKTDAVSLLWWNAMKECSATHREIDLVGTATPSIERFKASFSPETRNYADCSGYACSPMGAAAWCAERLPAVREQIARRLFAQRDQHDHDPQT